MTAQSANESAAHMWRAESMAILRKHGTSAIALVLILGPLGLLAGGQGFGDLRPKPRLPFEPGRFQKVAVSRANLETPLFDGRYVTVVMATSSGAAAGQIDLYCWVLGDATPDQLREQLESGGRSEVNELVLRPDFYTWKVMGDNGEVKQSWWAAFYTNEAGDCLTRVRLAPADLARSRLELLFNDIDNDGRDDQTSIVVDMKDFKWSRDFDPFFEAKSHEHNAKGAQ